MKTFLSKNIGDATLKAGVLALSLTPNFARADCQLDANGNPVVTGGASSGAQCSQPSTGNKPLFGPTGLFHQVADTLIFVIGAIAVIMLIIGGLRYVISQGNKDQVSGAKDTILYAIIGIIVAILAFAIVQFVTGSVQGTGSTTTG